MKKCAFLLCFLALITSATAAVNFSAADKGIGKLQIYYSTTVEGEVPRSIALRISLSDGAVLFSENGILTATPFRVYMDYLYEVEANNPGTYNLGNNRGHPAASPNGHGVASLPSSDFVISMATIYYEGQNMAAQEGTDIPLITLQLLNDANTIATITLDETRNGVFGSNGPLPTNLDSGASIQQLIDFSLRPCWAYLGQCHGDTNNDQVINLLDFNVLKNAWTSTQDIDVNYDACADFDKDGKVNLIDFNVMKTFWNSPAPQDCM